MRERCVRDAQHFVVVLVNAHLEVEAGELAQMAARVGVLGAKNWTHLEHALEIGRDRHLLVQLRRLREARRAPEVIGAEDLGPAFGLARDELGRVDLDKAALEQCLRAALSQLLARRAAATRAGVARTSRKRVHTPDWTRMMALFAGTRRSSQRLSRRCSWPMRGNGRSVSCEASTSSSGRAASSSRNGSTFAARETQ